MIPAAVRELESVLPTQSLPILLALGAFLIALLGAGLTGIIGMFCFWSPARGIFLIATILKILSSPALDSWSVETGWTAIFSETELLLDGVILTLCLVGPAKDLFKKMTKESNKVPQVIVATAPKPER